MIFIFQRLLYTSITILLAISLSAQKNSDDKWDSDKFSNLKMRSIGPAFMAGRIADIAIHPLHEHTWYVAVGSGGIWKTKNAGTTWKAIFENESVYSTGCVAIDPNNPEIIWVGTGENVGGRHVSFGDGVYKSVDGGENWTNMGLANSEHISEIIIHPDNSNIIYVASQGPLWNSDGDRGLFKSIDGGQSWKNILEVNKWTGVSDIILDPRDANVIYAATWQRHRTVAAYMGGGPGSGIYRSDNGGSDWKLLKEGLPEVNMGKIGIALSPQSPDHIYAAIELEQRQGGVFKSTNRGESWTKQSDAVAGATGPHYYQELYASPHQYDRIYLVDNNIQYSDNGGKTFVRMNEKDKHGDNHSINFKLNDPNYLLVGTDGGIYESLDLGENWRYISNMPITQFYKLAVDDAEPFYNIYGGTQDNSTECGPSRTDNMQGIQNSDWRVVLDWDGHQPATEPGNPNIAYGQRQEGNLARIDNVSGEVTDIQPQSMTGEPYERYNWDAPILVSPHSATRLYFASQRLWRSENRGDLWNPISKDLTRNENRIELPIMGSQKSIDNAWDFLAMSNYNTITSISESPVKENLIFIGTDDGLFSRTDDGGSSWVSYNLSEISNLPDRSYVNDIKADLTNPDILYLAADNHKQGDYTPYLMKSMDRGKTWQSIAGNLPNKTIVWRIVQDSVNPKLLFIGTEFGIYFSIDEGKRWTQITGNVPTISFRDLTIQKRENDLVAASFGRSFYIFDDIRVFQELSEEILNKEVHLFTTRDAWWYIPRSHLDLSTGKGSMGSAHFVAPNPDFGVCFTYYLKDALKSKKEIRRDEEKKMSEKSDDISFPGWPSIADEELDKSAELYIKIFNSNDEVINSVSCSKEAGFHRVYWDLHYSSSASLLNEKSADGASRQGILADPGSYYGILYSLIDGVQTQLSDAIRFEVKTLHKQSISNPSEISSSQFRSDYSKLVQKTSALQTEFASSKERASLLRQALLTSTISDQKNLDDIFKIEKHIKELVLSLEGNPVKLRMGEKLNPTINERLFSLQKTISKSTYGPTDTAIKTMGILNSEIDKTIEKLETVDRLMNDLSQRIYDAGGPYVKGNNINK